MKEAARFTCESCGNVTQSTIQNCWKHTGILFEDTEKEESVDNDNSLDDLLNQAPGCCYRCTDEYVNFDIAPETGETVNENDIIENINECESGSEELEAILIISSKDAIKAISTIIQCIEQPIILDLDEDKYIKGEVLTLLRKFKNNILLNHKNR